MQDAPATIRCLPGLPADSGTWYLPLCDWTASELLEAALEVDPDERRRGHGQVLAVDPALTLWCACRAANEGATVPTIADLAAWLDRHAAQLGASWTEEGPSLERPIDRGACVELAGAAVALAHQVAALAEQQAPQLAEPARLLALLHAAPKWLHLASAEARKPIPSDHPACLPGWLSSALTAIAARVETPGPLPDRHLPVVEPPVRGPSPANVAALVAAALCMPPESPMGGQLAAREGASRGESDPAWDQVRLRWQAQWPPLGKCWPRLWLCLARQRELESSFQECLEREKLAALKELAYGASHEINNPLTNISTRAQTLLRDEPDPERRRKLATINSQAFRAHEMISDLMLFARPPELQLSQVDLNPLVAQLVDELRPRAAAQQTDLGWQPSAEPIPILADPVQLSVAIVALAHNALEALGHGGRVDLVTRLDAAGQSVGETWAEVLLRDSGPGLDPRARRHLFDPFFSGREAGRGLGFGASKAWRIVTRHGGRIVVHSSPGQGTTLTLRLPRDGPRPRTPARDS